MFYMFKFSVLTLALLLSFQTSAYVIYKCLEENGSISYQKKPCIEDKSTILENIKKRQAQKDKTKNSTDMSENEFNDFIRDNTQGLSINLKSYNIKLLQLKSWRTFKKILGDDLLHVKFLSEEAGSEMSLLIDFFPSKNDKRITQKELNALILKEGKSMLLGSTQDKVEPIDMKVTDGIGVIAHFTDKNLLGKSSYPPGEYLNTTLGFIYTQGFLVHFTLLSNDTKSINYLFAITSMVGGTKISKLNKAKPQPENALDKAYDDYYNGNKRESVAQFEKITQKQPENFEAWMGLCLSSRDTNRLQLAFIACDKSLSLKPKNINIYESVINLYSQARVWNQGLVFIEKITPVSENKGLNNAITNFGFYALLDGKTNIAKKAYKAAIQRGAKNNKLTVDMAIVQFLEGSKSKAINDISKFLALNPSDKYALTTLNAIKDNNKKFFIGINETSYMEVPERLKQLGQGLNYNQKPDPWVNKIFPVKGIGNIVLRVPESWYENIQLTQSDKNTNKLSLKLLNLENLMVLSFDISKVNKSWTKDDLNKQMVGSLGVFFKEPEINLTPLPKNNGFEFSGLSELEKGVKIYISKRSELKGLLSVSSLLMAYKKDAQTLEQVSQIRNNIKVTDYDATPLLAGVEKSNLSNKPANETELPEAPVGFSWVRMQDIKAAFLKPDGWFEHDQKTKDGHTYAISQESVKTYGSFDTGLTVQGLSDVLNKIHSPPYAIALNMLEDIKSSKSNTIIKLKDLSQGPFKSFFVRYENNPEVAEAIIVHKIFIANDKTSSLYIVTFESPKASWNQAWKTGNTILKYYLVDDEF